MVEFMRLHYRGICVCAIGGMAAHWLSGHYNTPAMLLALLLGLAVHFLYEDETIALGIDYVAKNILRIGVGLLGLRIVFGDVVQGGWSGPIIVIIAMLATFVAGAFCSRFFGSSQIFAWLSAGAVAVCGVSAAIAICSVLPKRKQGDEELAVVIISVTALSTIAMIIYPLVASALSFDDQQAGIFIGGTIHDVAQVVGAGYSISDESGDIATYIKLMRVALLLPIVLLIGAMNRQEAGEEKRPPLVPLFLVVFIALAGLNSFNLIPTVLSEIGISASRAMLVMSIFAIGVKSQLKDIFKVGPRPFLLVLIETFVMAFVVIAGLVIL